MTNYLLRRLLVLIPTMLLLSFLVFFLMRLMPGDVVDAMMSAPGAGDVEFDRDAIVRALGLDVPLPVQYARWMGIYPHADGSFRGIFQGDLGISWSRKRPVVDIIVANWPVTLQLAFMSLVVSQLIALPIGIYSALRQDKWGDYISRSFAILCISVPSFWLGTMVIVYPSIWWGYMPPIMLIHFNEDPIGNLRMFILPAIIMGMALSGVTMRMTRTMMLEVLRQDYIRTAWSKGLREKVVVIRHALKNALIPVITILGIQIPNLLGGTVIVENIFSLPGMGRLILSSTMQRDYPLVTGILLFFSVVLVLVNLMVDLTYAFLDPRVGYK